MQDMNNLEAMIVEKVGATRFLVGDSKQAIFAFQGGSTTNFSQFAKTCKGFLLSFNMRSTQEILDYAKTHFLGLTVEPQRYEMELDKLKSSRNGKKPQVIQTSSPLTVITELLKNYTGKKVGILTNTNSQIRKISKFLEQNQIQYSSTISKITTADARKQIIDYVRGIFSDKLEDKITAAFTVFSPYTIQDAFKMSKDFSEKKLTSSNQIQGLSSEMTLVELYDRFEKIIFPVCVSKGLEWYESAVEVKDQITEFLLGETPLLENLLDFLSITEESISESDSISDITISTVHKAKGLEFDIVIYLPSTNERTDFTQLIAQTVLESNNIDISSELADESLRINFVAFTRARDELIIITNSEDVTSFHNEKYSSLVVDARNIDNKSVINTSQNTEAYKLFLSGKTLESQKLLNSPDPWLKDYIHAYFQNLRRLSPTKVTPYADKFFKNRIFVIPGSSESLDFGNDVHEAIKLVNKQLKQPIDFEGEVRQAVENMILARNQLETIFPELDFQDELSEKLISMPLDQLIPYNGPPIEFSMKMDAVYKHKNGILIVDYKTDKNKNHSSDHKRQLAVYKKMYAKIFHVAEDKISTCVVFVALRGSINTGKFEMDLEHGHGPNVFNTFLEHLNKILSWKQNPQSFIDELTTKLDDSPLNLAIKQKLA